jgi:hypothetical protein
MFVRKTERWALALLATIFLIAPAAAEQVVCRYTYGGESRELAAAPVASPYAVPSIQVGSYFRFRVVFQKAPADLASVRIYVYADRDEGAAPLHEAVYPYPVGAAKHARFGFTGQHFVYEPMRDGELEYWCRMDEGGEAKR